MTAQQNMQALQDAVAASIVVGSQAIFPATKTIERLPFSVKIVANEEELRKAVSIRRSAYARHVPAFAQQLEEPETADRESGSIVLLAQSHLDGTALGTMRIQTNRYSPLKLEQSVDLPLWLQDRSLAEATRLGVSEGSIGRVVKTVLFKAYYLYCRNQGIDWMVITARKPLDRQYEMLMFQDVYDGELIPMRHVGDIPHRVLAFDVAAAKQRWTDAGHPLLGYMCDVHHPDIDIIGDDFGSFGGTIRGLDRLGAIAYRV